ncbi:MAG TPA: DUF488 domain-containing protein [Actinomycetota bacterium]|nr:DUF488 domain-containing protein [Actinomycetota bacterium]
MTVTVVTVGHGARVIDAFVDLLVGAGVRRLVDIRTAPASRKHPHFGKDALSATLEGAGIAYEWWGRELGGWRRPHADSRHTALRSAGFRGYADHMETDQFRAALDRLISSSRDTRTAIMCAESLWWRCHRRMVADALVAAGCRVEHLMEGGRLDPHRLSPAARSADGVLVYDVVTSEVSPGRPSRTRRAAPSGPPAG